MAEEDKLLGVRVNGNSKNRVYSAYRIDYDTQLSIVEIGRDTGDIGANESSSSYFTSSIKNPPHEYSGHEAKSGYQRKVLVEDQTTRDEVTAILDSAGVSYTTEDVSPTDAEKAHIEDYGAESSLEGKAAMQWKRMLDDFDKGNISAVDVERGRNPHEGTHPGRGKGGPPNGLGN